MATKKINITIEYEDNSVIESNLISLIGANFGIAPSDITILPNTKELYEKSEHFRKLIKDKKRASRAIGDYINKYNK